MAYVQEIPRSDSANTARARVAVPEPIIGGDQREMASNAFRQPLIGRFAVYALTEVCTPRWTLKLKYCQ